MKNDRYIWCLEQVDLRHRGELDQEKIDKLDSVCFNWKYYESELNKLGYHWEKNKPEEVQND